MGLKEGRTKSDHDDMAHATTTTAVGVWWIIRFICLDRLGFGQGSSGNSAFGFLSLSRELVVDSAPGRLCANIAIVLPDCCKRTAAGRTNAQPVMTNLSVCRVDVLPFGVSGLQIDYIYGTLGTVGWIFIPLIFVLFFSIWKERKIRQMPRW